MLKVMVVAGNTTDSLSNYLRERGSVEVSASYNSLYKNYSNINSSIIKVDRLVYVYQDSKLISIKDEMSCLKKLLKDNSFFTVGEIYFFCENKNSDIAIPYFRSVMQDCNINNYTIDSNNDSLPYTKIYDTLIGTNKVLRHKTKYKNVYRTEKGFESKVSYEEDEDNFFCEPFTEEGLKRTYIYNRSVVRTDNGYQHIDNKDVTGGVYQNPDLGSFSSKLTRSKNTVVVTGNRYSGKTTYACSLAVSAVKSGKSVLLIDMCKNSLSNCLNTIDRNNIKYNTINMVSIISNNININESDINILNCSDLKDYKTRFDMLQYYYSNCNNLFDLIIIDCVSDDFHKCSVIINSMLYRCFVCCIPNEIQVEEIKDYILLSDRFETIVMLGSNIKYNCGQLDPQEVKESLENKVKVISPIDLDDIDVEPDLYYNLLEVI